MMKRSLILAAAFALVVPAVARAAPALEITALTATVSGSDIAVDGVTSGGGQDPMLVGEDAAGDNLGGPIGAAMGLDFTELLIARPDASRDDVVFTMRFADLGEGIPEGVQYNWDIMVDGGDFEGGSNWSIKMMRSNVVATGHTDPSAGLYSCVPSDTGFSCTKSFDLPVDFDPDAKEIRITAPMSSMGASSGSLIFAWGRNGQPVWVRSSAAGQLTGGATFDDTSHDDYVVPQREVTLGIASPGTPEQDVVFDTPAQVDGSGRFIGSLTAGGPGVWDVWARSCFADECVASSVPVSVG